MPASKAELWDQLAKAVAIIDHAYNAGANDSTNLSGLITALDQAFEGDHISSTKSGITSMRSSWSGLIASSKAILNSLILELAKVGYNSTATSVTNALDDIAAGMDSASETIRERDFTFASASTGGSNVGNGKIFRVLQDRYGNPLEAAFGGSVRWECTKDAITGSSVGQEQGSIRGLGTTKVDEIDLGTATNSSASLNLGSTNKITSQSSFNVANIASLTAWTQTGSLDIDTSNYHREVSGATNGSLKFTGNGEVTRSISSANIDASKPLIFIVAYNKQIGSGDGVITLSLGSQTEDITLASETGWNYHSIGTGASKKGWYNVFKESGSTIDIGIELSSNTTGYVLIDDALLVQPTLFDGLYYVVIPGTTDFQVGDIISFADTVANTGRMQYWIQRHYGKSLPSDTDTNETYSDA